MSGRIALEHDDLAFGYAIGKAHALAEWAHRREEREFRQLCNRLRVAKWYREIKAEGGERWERALASYRRGAVKWRAKKREAKLERFLAGPQVRTCARPGCGTDFPVLFRAGQPRRFCSPRCAKVDLEQRCRAERTEEQRQRRREKAERERGSHACPQCGATVPAVEACGRVSRRRFCSRPCAKRAAADRKRAAWEAENPSRACEHCGAAFVPSYQPGAVQIHCSARCRIAHRVSQRGSACT